MYNIKNKSEVFYIYDVHMKHVIYKFFSLKDLLVFLASYENNGFQYPKSKYLRNINMGSDTMKWYHENTYYTDDGEPHTALSLSSECAREYLFFDGYGRTIDPRIYLKEIEKLESDIFWDRCSKDINYVRYVHPFNEKTIVRKPFSSVEYRKKKELKNKFLPEFRKGPIHHVHKNRVGRYYYRHFRTFNERKQNADPEVAEYVRPCRRHDSMILDPWENERVRPWRNHSWKDCTKKRKQWM